MTAPIGRHPVDRMKMAVAAAAGVGGAREARSIVHTLGTDGRRSVVAVLIRTGRTHQIRVHLQHLRHPILGDPTYGDSNWNRLEARRAARPMLHAFQLRLRHPLAPAPAAAAAEGGAAPAAEAAVVDGEEEDEHMLCVTAPPPDDLAALVAGIVACEPTQAAVGEWLSARVAEELAYSLDGFEF